MSKEPELKPCPFCGVRLTKSETFSTRTRGFYVHPLPDVLAYDNCPLTDYRVTSNDPDRIAAWNTRANPLPDVSGLVEALRDLRLAFMMAADKFGFSLDGSQSMAKASELVAAFQSRKEGKQP